MGAIRIPEYLDSHSGYSAPRSRIAGIYLQALFLTKRKELSLCASERFSMRSGMPQGMVVMREWEDLGCAAYQSHVYQKVVKFDLHHVEKRRHL